MNREIKEKILKKIKEYSRIMIFRHRRPDGDCVGASKGLKDIIKSSFPGKEVYIIDSMDSEYLAFMGQDDAPMPDEAYADALAIVVDTSNTERISNQKFSLCREIIKIDHHIDHTPFGDISWVEDSRSSACEMIADFYVSFKDELVLSDAAALAIYTGMVTDSGRFRYEGVTGDTLRLAAVLLDRGIDTERLYANLYLDDYEHYKFLAHIYTIMKRSENGVAYLYIDRALQKEYGLSFESASSVVSSMDAIKGSICWLAFIENPEEDSIRVRLRSRFMAVNTLAEEFGGGGHANASGATVYSVEEMEKLIERADSMVKSFKAEHEDVI